MGQYTLDTDFAALNRQKAEHWIAGFCKMADEAFVHCDDGARLLAHLLILEQYVHTLENVLSGVGKRPSAVLQYALDMLWSYLETHSAPIDFQDYANNLFASAAAYHTGEALTEAQEMFYNEQFGNAALRTVEWEIITWISELLIYLVASEGGRLDFDINANESANCKQIPFTEIDLLIGFFTEACQAGDDKKTEGMIYQTPLFQQFIANIVACMKTALIAQPTQFGALRKEYQQYTLIPKEYAADFMG